jgi:hypothetical protein
METENSTRDRRLMWAQLIAALCLIAVIIALYLIKGYTHA